MLNDSTLAHGQADNPSTGGQITVAKTQTLPGVGPTDDGKSLVDLAAASEPHGGNRIGLPLILVGISLLALGAFGAAVLWRRRNGGTA